MIVPSGIATSSATNGHGQRAGDERHDAVVRIGEQRRPHRVGQEVADRDVLEEDRRFVDQDRDDRERREHRHEPRGQQHGLRRSDRESCGTRATRRVLVAAPWRSTHATSLPACLDLLPVTGGSLTRANGALHDPVRGGRVRSGRYPAPATACESGRGLRHSVTACASMASSWSIVTPIFGTPPNTVPSLPSWKCCQARS